MHNQTKLLEQISNISQNLPKHSLLNSFKRKLLSMIVRYEVGTTTFWGQKFYTYSNDQAAYCLQSNGILREKEHKLIKFLINHIKHNSVFYDIGANYGFYSSLVCNLADQAKVFAFEPSFTLMRCLRKNIDETRCTVINKAVSINDSERILISYSKNNLSMGSLQNTEDVSGPKKQGREVVSSISLDKFSENNPDPDFIKIDVEGHEAAVIEGGLKLLTRANPIISMEIMREKALMPQQSPWQRLDIWLITLTKTETFKGSKLEK